MSTENLARAFAMTRGILTNVTPDQFDLPTPCASWDVRALINHVVEGANWFGLCVEAGAAPEEDPTAGVDYAGGDLLGSFDAGAARSLAAFAAPGALDKAIDLPFGTMPGGAFLGIATDDVFAHGWDLAKATGQPTDLDPELAASLLAQMEAFLPPEIRGADGVAPFGPATDAPEGASAADRLAAFLGRTV
ncbi:MAG TPA: TIGR03086 family metal-binding protein [Acidimicrobiales bacterium]|nr:TIGR03086 family metal-binding protein [Acidimicrobiales bacterium]